MDVIDNSTIIKKNPCGKFIGAGKKLFIISMYKYLLQTQNENPDSPRLTYRQTLVKLSKSLGFGLVTIQNTLSEYRKYGTVSQPNKTKYRQTIVDKIDEFDKNAIRLKIHDFWRNREVPTISKILIVINEDPTLPNLKRPSFKILLEDLKFGCVKLKKNRNNALLERDDLITWRRNYLEKIRYYRAENRPIYYLDETWINVGETQSRTWVDTTMKSSGEAFIEGKTTGQKEPSRKGKRLIVLHIGSTDGFVPGGLLCFESKTNSINYHDINSDIFYDWFERILPLLKENAVIVMDNASHHSVKKFQMPTKSWKKQNIIDWLDSKGEIVKHPVLKIDLLKKVRQLRQYDDEDVLDEYANDYQKLVIRLPPYHCGLNPIKLAWVSVKNYVGTHNTPYELKDVIELLKKGLENVTPEMWTNFVGHVIEEEEKFWNIESIIEEILNGELEERNTSSSDSG